MNISIAKFFLAQLICLKNNMLKVNKKSGFIVLISVLIISSIVLSISLMIVLVNINSSKNSLSTNNANQARLLANTCSEYALQEIALDTNIFGSFVLSLGDDTCNYSIYHGAGEERVIESWSEIRGSVRRERVVIDSFSPNINIASWQEIADF